MKKTLKKKPNMAAGMFHCSQCHERVCMSGGGWKHLVRPSDKHKVINPLPMADQKVGETIPPKVKLPRTGKATVADWEPVAESPKPPSDPSSMGSKVPSPTNSWVKNITLPWSSARTQDDNLHAVVAFNGDSLDVRIAGYTPDAGDVSTFRVQASPMDGRPQIVLHGRIGVERDIHPVTESSDTKYSQAWIDANSENRSYLIAMSPTTMLGHVRNVLNSIREAREFCSSKQERDDLLVIIHNSLSLS